MFSPDRVFFLFFYQLRDQRKPTAGLFVIKKMKSLAVWGEGAIFATEI